MTADGPAAPPVVRNREQRRNERQHDQAIIRAGLRRLLAGRAEHHSLWDCGNPLPDTRATTIDRDHNGRISYGNLVRCGSKQLCVTCAARGRGQDAGLVSWRVDSHFETGGGISMLSIAPRHRAGERLAPMKAQLVDAFSDTFRSSMWKQIEERYGIIGWAKVFECTCGEHGWHPHLHVLLFHARFIDVTEGEERELVHTFWRLFNRNLASWASKACRHPEAAKAGIVWTADPEAAGGRRAEYRKVSNAEWYDLPDGYTRDADLAHGIDFVPITKDGEASGRVSAYVGKIALEMTRSDLKTGKAEGSRSLFQIMNDYGHTHHPADAALILEAIDVLKGIQLVSWGGAFNHKDALYGQPTDQYKEQAMRDYCQSQGLEPPTTDQDKQTIAGLAPDVHRAADRATDVDGHPLLWKARIVLEQTGRLADLVDVLNEVLAPVALDHTTDLPYPLIRFVDPPPVPPVDGGPSIGADIDHLHRSVRQAGEAKRREIIDMARHPTAKPSAPNPEPGERRQAPPGGWINYWRNVTNADLKGRERTADRRLDVDDERSTDGNE